MHDFFPWTDEAGPLDAILDHPATGHATAAALAAEGGIRAARFARRISRSRIRHPSGKVEFVSERAASFGLPALPEFETAKASAYPLALRSGRTLTQFHSFYDHGRALPSLAAADPEPRLWISPADAARRALGDGDDIRIFNERGEMRARAFVTDRVPPGTGWMRDGWAGLNTLVDGNAIAPDRPGNGLVWNEEAVKAIPTGLSNANGRADAQQIAVRCVARLRPVCYSRTGEGPPSSCQNPSPVSRCAVSFSGAIRSAPLIARQQERNRLSSARRNSGQLTVQFTKMDEHEYNSG